MRTKVLPPIKESPDIYDQLELIIRKLFRDELFAPIAKELQTTLSVQNASSTSLIDAIRSGRVTFNRGEFYGTFSANVSKELKALGAKFSRANKTFKIQINELPYDVRAAIDSSLARFAQTQGRIDRMIQQIVPEEIAKRLTTENFFDKVLYTTDEKIKSRLKAIIVSPTLSEEARGLIAKEYTENLQKYVAAFATGEKKVLKEKMLALRADTSQHILRGGRQKAMAEIIQDRYQVSANKAKFLARQETGLLMAKFQQARYKDSGITDYIWKCVAGTSKHPVRPMHKRLDGTKQSWDNPPITDDKNNRNNPGEDYNCRCFAMPIVKYNL